MKSFAKICSRLWGKKWKFIGIYGFPKSRNKIVTCDLIQQLQGVANSTKNKNKVRFLL